MATFISTAADETITGGPGVDTVTYAGLGTGIRLNLGVTTAQDTLGGGVDTITGVENAIGTGQADRITGNNADNVLHGGAGNDALGGGARNDTLFGDAGDDTLTGGTGDDVLNGGDGFDVAGYLSATSGVTVFLTTSAAQDTGGAGIDQLFNIEGLIGSAFDDRLTGNRFDNLLSGEAGNDVLVGRDGNDTLAGGAGDDVLNGGAGIDTARYISATQGVRVDLSVFAFQDTGEGMDRLLGIENVIGSGFGDVLKGDLGANVLEGGAGDDVLDGGDALNPSFTDVLNGGTGNDTVTYANYSAGVRVFLDQTGVQDTLGGGLDQLVSIENVVGTDFDDVIVGDAFANVLTGGAGGDTLQGGQGADRIDGGTGQNYVQGNSGADSFYFTTELGTGNVTYIQDFLVEADTIYLDSRIFTGLSVGQLAAGELQVGRGAGEAAIAYEDGSLYFNQDGAWTWFANIPRTNALTEADFIVI